jgi:peroxiredoxin
MKTFLWAALCSALSLPAWAALKPGDTAPDFSAQASLAGKAFNYSLRDALKKGPVVVYFYPSAYTNGCNAQAHAFATNMDRFQAGGATVVGVSLDNIQRLNEFSADPDYCAGKLPVASDVDGKIAKSYDLMIRQGAAGMKDSRGKEINHDMAERTTFLVTPDGKVAATIGGVTPTENVDQALAAVQKLKKK